MNKFAVGSLVLLAAAAAAVGAAVVVGVMVDRLDDCEAGFNCAVEDHEH